MPRCSSRIPRSRSNGALPRVAFSSTTSPAATASSISFCRGSLRAAITCWRYEASLFSCFLPPACFLPLPRRPREAAAAEHVQMDVEDRLPCLCVGVEDRPEPAVGVALIARHRGGAAEHLTDQRLVAGLKIVQRRNVPLRDDQRVQRRLRVDVVEDHEVVVFVDYRCGNLLAHDAAEQAIGHGVRLSATIWLWRRGARLISRRGRASCAGITPSTWDTASSPRGSTIVPRSCCGSVCPTISPASRSSTSARGMVSIPSKRSGGRHRALSRRTTTHGTAQAGAPAKERPASSWRAARSTRESRTSTST